MATRLPSEGHVRPEVGDTLLVIRESMASYARPALSLTLIDDFHARSSDELSLGKGDRVELIERDDEFGDGWFLGRHLINGNTGLFPEGLSFHVCLLLFPLSGNTKYHSLHPSNAEEYPQHDGRSC